MLRGILFPYANKFIRRSLDSAINRRFSLEFTRLIALMGQVMIKIMAGQENIDGYYDLKDEISNQMVGAAQENPEAMNDSSMDLSFDARADT